MSKISLINILITCIILILARSMKLHNYNLEGFIKLNKNYNYIWKI
jgi:hypothetical protein